MIISKAIVQQLLWSSQRNVGSFSEEVRLELKKGNHCLTLRVLILSKSILCQLFRLCTACESYKMAMKVKVKAKKVCPNCSFIIFLYLQICRECSYWNPGPYIGYS